MLIPMLRKLNLFYFSNTQYIPLLICNPCEYSHIVKIIQVDYSSRTIC